MLMLLALGTLAAGVYSFFSNCCLRQNMDTVIILFLVSILLMIVSAILLRNNIKPWEHLAWSYSIIVFVVFGILYFFGKNPDTHYDKSDYYDSNIRNSNTGTVTTANDTYQAEEAPASQTISELDSPCGKYTVTDHHGTIWTIIIKEDETITIEGGRIHNNTYYGSWMWEERRKVVIRTNFTSEDTFPPLVFPVSEGNSDGMFLVIDLGNKYIYASGAYNSKNPRKRLTITKQN